MLASFGFVVQEPWILTWPVNVQEVLDRSPSLTMYWVVGVLGSGLVLTAVMSANLPHWSAPLMVSMRFLTSVVVGVGLLAVAVNWMTLYESLGPTLFTMPPGAGKVQVPVAQVGAAVQGQTKLMYHLVMLLAGSAGLDTVQV